MLTLTKAELDLRQQALRNFRASLCALLPTEASIVEPLRQAAYVARDAPLARMPEEWTGHICRLSQIEEAIDHVDEALTRRYDLRAFDTEVVRPLPHMLGAYAQTVTVRAAQAAYADLHSGDLRRIADAVCKHTPWREFERLLEIEIPESFFSGPTDTNWRRTPRYPGPAPGSRR